MKLQFETRELNEAEIHQVSDELFKEAYIHNYKSKEESIDQYIDVNINFYSEDLFNIHTDKSSVIKIKEQCALFMNDRKKKMIVMIGDKIKLISGPNVQEGELQNLECEVINVNGKSISIRIPSGRFSGESWNLRLDQDIVEIL